MADDVVFTFDESPFVNGIKAATRAMDTMESRAQAITKGIVGAVTGVVTRLAIMKTAFDGIRSAINEIPEIGQAFGIAKDIILKNFLFPIRQAILPLLQNILDWVRDNRSAFARWGAIVVNVFRVAASVARELFDAIRTIGRAVGRLVRDIFGLPESFEESVNLILFKIAAVAAFLGEIFEPVGDAIARVVDFLGPYVKRAISIARSVIEVSARLGLAFGEGLFEGLTGINESFVRIEDSISRIIDRIFGSQGVAEWEERFRSLGYIIGGQVKRNFELFADVLERIADWFETFQPPEWLQFGRILREGGPEAEELWQQELERRGQQRERREGQNERLQEGFQGFLDLFRGSQNNGPVSRAGSGAPGLSAIGGNNGAISMSVDMSGATFYVTEGNAEAAGRNFARGTAVGLTDQVNQDLLRFGG